MNSANLSTVAGFVVGGVLTMSICLGCMLNPLFFLGCVPTGLITAFAIIVQFDRI
jgi:hypothetical protein